MELCKVHLCINYVTEKGGLCPVHTKEKFMVIKCRSCGHESLSGVHECKGFDLNAPLASETAIDKQVGGKHYKKHAIQPWHIIDEYELDFYLGNTVKYVLRTKGSQIEDLEKAIHYLERKVELLKTKKEHEHTGSLFDGLDDDSEDHTR